MMMRRLVFLATIAAAGCAHRDARPVPGGDPARGHAAIVAAGCGACHEIDGVDGAHGKVGPPLSGVAQRSMIGGVLPNTPENMIRWIEDAPSISPHTAMPDLGLTPDEARDITAYLYAR